MSKYGIRVEYDDLYSVPYGDDFNEESQADRTHEEIMIETGRWCPYGVVVMVQCDRGDWHRTPFALWGVVVPTVYGIESAIFADLSLISDEHLREIAQELIDEVRSVQK